MKSTKASIAQIVIAFAEYYDKVLSQTQLAMYVEDLLTISPEQLQAAVKQYRSDPRNDRFPLPAKLIAISKPVENEKDIGQIVAARILTGISKCGHNNHEQAKEFVGEIGWEVVRLQGGWANLCQLSSDDLRQEQPRWRELAISISKRATLGTLHEAPRLPSSGNSQKGEFKTIGQVMTGLLEKARDETK